MSNPYQSPGDFQPANRQQVQGPAIALIVVSSIAIFLGVVGLAFDVVFILTGVVERLEAMNDGPVSEYTQIAIRGIWGVILVLASSFVLYGAINMKNMTDYSTAKAASIVAMIPLIGPCCILGIPFGIWALVTLNKPGVKSKFSRS